MEFLTSYSWYSKWFLVSVFVHRTYQYSVAQHSEEFVFFIFLEMFGREQFLAFYVSGGKKFMLYN